MATPAALSPFRDDAFQESDSAFTVAVALIANVMIAIAKSVAAAVTNSSSMPAEVAHSWADAGNEVFLVIANRRSRRPTDDPHPLGYGREAYVWSMFAALGLFAAGAAVSITHGITELFSPTEAENFEIGYIVLAIAFVLEGISFLQSTRQATKEADTMQREDPAGIRAGDLDPTLRAVFARTRSH